MSDPIEPLLRELAGQPKDAALLERVQHELIGAGRISSLVKILEWWSKRVDDPAVVADGYSRGALALYGQTQDERVTRDLFEAALENAPAHEPPVQRYANFLETLGDRERLFQMLEEHADAVERTGDVARGAAAWSQLAETRRRLGDLDGAIMALSRAQSVAPRDMGVLLTLVERYLERAQQRPERSSQDRQLAVDLLVRAASTDPNNVARFVGRALDLAPGSERALQALERLVAGQTQEQRDAALIPRLEAFLAIQSDPASHGPRRIALARAYEADGRLDEALQCIAFLPPDGEVDSLRARLEQQRDRRSRPRHEASVVAVLAKLEAEDSPLTMPAASALGSDEATRTLGADFLDAAQPDYDAHDEATAVGPMGDDAEKLRAAIAAAKSASSTHDESGVDEDAPTNALAAGSPAARALAPHAATEIGMPAVPREPVQPAPSPSPLTDPAVVMPPAAAAPVAAAPVAAAPVASVASAPAARPSPLGSLDADSEEFTNEVDLPAGVVPRDTPGGRTAPMDRVDLPPGVQLRREETPVLGLYGPDDEEEDDYLVRGPVELIPMATGAKRASQGGASVVHLLRFREERGLGFERFTASVAKRSSKHSPIELKVGSGGAQVRLTKAGLDAQAAGGVPAGSATQFLVDGSSYPVENVGEWFKLKVGEGLEIQVGSMIFVARVLVEHEAEQTVADAIPFARWGGSVGTSTAVHLFTGLALGMLLSTGVVSLEVEDRTREEIFAEAMLAPEPPPEQPEPERPRPRPRQQRPTEPSEERQPQQRTNSSVVARALRNSRGSAEGGSASERLAALTSGAPSAGTASLAEAVTNIDAVQGNPGSAALAVGGQLRGVAGLSAPNIGTSSGRIGTLGGTNATEGVGNITAMGTGGRVRGRVRNVSALTRVSGSLSRGEIQQVVNRASGRIQRCYERGLASQPSLSGRVVYSWTITTSGRASGVRKASGGLGNANVENCIAGVIRRLRFPRPRGGPVTVSAYPFIFSRAQ